MKNRKRAAALAMVCALGAMAALTGCQKKAQEVVIYTNADDEAIEAMKNALDGNGYEGKYILQSFGTSELGGKTSGGGNQYRGRSGHHEFLLFRQRTGGESDVSGPVL